MSAIEFWLPPEDEDLIGIHSSRDPLGFLSIWSQRGRSVVPNLTEQTDEARGFQLLVTAFRLWEDFQVKHADAKVRVEEFFLLIEQAFAYSTQSRTKEWPLPGRERVVKFTRGGTPRLSLKNGILANQLSNGVWGLYRGAAFRSGILHESMRCLSVSFRLDMGDDTRLDGRLRDQLFRTIRKVHEDRDHGVEFSLHGARQLPDQLAEILSKVPQKSLLRRYLLPPGSLEERVAKLLYENRNTFWNDASYRRVFINQCIGQFPQERDLFEQILRCENFIAPVEKVFRRLFRFAGKQVKSAASAMDIDLATFRDAFHEFRASGPYSGGTTRRFAIYHDGIQISSKQDFVRSILTCHRKVAADRRREPWITDESDKLQVLVNVEDSSEDAPLDAIPGNTWINDYYLTPLLSVYTRLRS
jgi:hypothetical protein